MWINLPSLANQMERHIHDVRDRFGVADAPTCGSLTDYLKDAYEVGEDGKVSVCVCVCVYVFALLV